MGRFHYINHTADLALELEAESLDDLLKTAAQAWQRVVLESSHIVPGEFRFLHLSADTPEELIVQFLSELNYLLLVKTWATAEIEQLHIFRRDDQLNLSARLSGEPYSSDRHQIQVEIKAVTFHQLQVETGNRHWRTRLVFDV